MLRINCNFVSNLEHLILLNLDKHCVKCLLKQKTFLETKQTMNCLFFIFIFKNSLTTKF